MLQNVAKVTTLNLRIVSKLTGINSDPKANGAFAPASRRDFEPIGSVSVIALTGIA